MSKELRIGVTNSPKAACSCHSQSNAEAPTSPEQQRFTNELDRALRNQDGQALAVLIASTDKPSLEKALKSVKTTPAAPSLVEAIRAAQTAQTPTERDAALRAALTVPAVK